MNAGEEKKYNTVLRNNTFFFRAEEFEKVWESHIASITNSLLILKQKLESCVGYEQRKDIIVDFIREDNGLTAFLAFLGISEEFFLRLLTNLRLARHTDEELDRLMTGIPKEEGEINEIKEWKKQFVWRKVREDRDFAASIVNLLIEGPSTHTFRRLPLFELKKFGIKKLNFDTEALLDTIIRLVRKGSYTARPETNPQGLLKKVLEKNDIPFEEGKDLDKLPEDIRRNIDFVIPNHENPRIIVQCSYEVTTSSGMEDKARAEVGIARTLKEKYPESVFVGFVDGIGWYVRRSTLKRIVGAFENVFTFEHAEIERFLRFVREVLEKKND